jgi:hypothetical protein
VHICRVNRPVIFRPQDLPSDGFTALAPRFRWLLGTTDTHARRERRVSLRRRGRGLLSLNYVSLCPAKTRVRENGDREEEGNGTVTVESRPESRGAYLRCSFFSCFAVHDVITSDTTRNSHHVHMDACLRFILLEPPGPSRGLARTSSAGTSTLPGCCGHSPSSYRPRLHSFRC